jgi:hypothetical protein
MSVRSMRADNVVIPVQGAADAYGNCLLSYVVVNGATDVPSCILSFELFFESPYQNHLAVHFKQ